MVSVRYQLHKIINMGTIRLFRNPLKRLPRVHATPTKISMYIYTDSHGRKATLEHAKYYLHDLSHSQATYFLLHGLYCSEVFQLHISQPNWYATSNSKSNIFCFSHFDFVQFQLAFSFRTGKIDNIKV